MTTETKSDTKRVPHPGYRFWLFDPEGDGMTYYRTAEDRDKAAAGTCAASFASGAAA